MFAIAPVFSLALSLFFQLMVLEKKILERGTGKKIE